MTNTQNTQNAQAKSFEKATAQATEAGSKVAENMQRSYDDYAKLQKETLDSFAQAFSLWSKGIEDLNKDFFARVQDSFGKNLSDSKNLGVAKDPQEFLTNQNEISTKALNEMLNTSAFLSERTVKLANQSFEPVQKQMSKNLDVFVRYFSV